MTLWNDVRFAFRLLVRQRWLMLAAAVPLALGIASNAAVFTLVNAVLIRGLPFDEADRIVAVWMETPEGQEAGLSLPDAEDLGDESSSLEALGLTLNATVNVSDDEQAPVRVLGSYVSGDFFDVLGVQPTLGRGFTRDDAAESAPPVVLLGNSLWESRYGSDPGVLGRVIRVNSLPASVIGVMPPGMRFPGDNDIWIPHGALPPASDIYNRGVRSFSGIGRLAEGATVEQARLELRAVADRLADEYPGTNADLRPNVSPYQEQVNGPEIRTMFLALMGAVAFVLLIACANVANLLLARSTDRAREISVRVSQGATRWHVIRQLLVESLMLSAIAGLMGFGLAVAGVRWFDAVTQDVGKPYWMEFTLDPIVFVFVAGVCLATAVLFGLAPALQVSKTDVNEVLKEGTRGGTGGIRARRWAAALVIGEVVLTLVLLSGAAFMMRSFLNMASLDEGFDTSDLIVAALYLPLTQYPEPGPRTDLYRAFEERLAATPEIRRFAIATAPPLAGGSQRPLEVDGRETEEGTQAPPTTTVSVSDGYFETLGLEPTLGRTLRRGDGEVGSEVVVVNERFVELHLGGGEAVGRRIRVPLAESPLPEGAWFTVVGVVPNVRQISLEDPEPDPVVYLPLRADPQRVAVVLVRRAGGASGVVAALQDAMRSVNPDLPVSDIRTMDQLLVQARWPFRTFGLMFTVFAGIALVMSAVGLYSVTAYSVAQRTREIGIRMALGAEPAQMSWMALRRAVIQLAVAVPVGVLGALGVGQVLRGFLVRTGPADVLTLAVIVGVLSSVALVACLVPARRAARLDPVAALRVE